MRSFHSNADRLEEGIDYADSVDDLAVLKVFSEDDLASGDLGAMNDERVPVGDVMEPVEIDRGQYIAQPRLYKVESGKDLKPSASDSRVQAKLSRCIYEIFLQHLKRDNARPI